MDHRVENVFKPLVFLAQFVVDDTMAVEQAPLSRVKAIEECSTLLTPTCGWIGDAWSHAPDTNRY